MSAVIALPLLALCFAPMLRADTPAAPWNVSALVYSTSAAELFWEQPAGLRLELHRNGELLGTIDARSRFEAGLVEGLEYRYELRTVDGEGDRSLPVRLQLSTTGFRLPIRRVLPEGQQQAYLDTPAPAPAPVVTPEPPEVSSAGPSDASSDASSDTSSDAVSVQVLVEPDAAPSRDDASTAQRAPASACGVFSLSNLQTCLTSASSGLALDIRGDLHCVGSDCCPAGSALIELAGMRDIAIYGNGFQLRRSAGHRQCSLLDIRNSQSVSIIDWHLDDDVSVAPCRVEDGCPRMVHVRHSRDVAFEDSSIRHGKGYTVYVQGTDGFRFERSELRNAGVLGMYIGHSSDASRRVVIRDSVFRDNQTNALALLGVTGNSLADNIVENNRFLRNHRRGQWQVAPQYGTGYTGGGQLYIAQANHLSVRDNVVSDGYCDNCFVQRRARSGVSGIELGLPGKQSVSDIVIARNIVSNHDGNGIGKNVGSPLGANVTITANRLYGNTTGLSLGGALPQTSVDNTVSDTDRFWSFESASLAQAGFDTELSCSSGGEVGRVCGVPSRFGQCVARLALAASDCESPRATLIGPSVTVQAGQSVHVAGWVSQATGRWCVRFSDTSGNALGENCVDLDQADDSDVQAFTGTPLLVAGVPPGATRAQVAIHLDQVHTRLDIDDLKLSIGTP